jgi:uncharacterized membrane protein YphA (DoxX/SURF4 family)
MKITVTGLRVAVARPLSSAVIRWVMLLMLCAAYLQGSLTKLLDWPAALSEMEGFGLYPPGAFAAGVIALELACSAMILTGIGRWLGALLLAGFTLAATGLALRFWTLPLPARGPAENAFFEHLGLAGGLLLVAWQDLARPGAYRPAGSTPRTGQNCL